MTVTRAVFRALNRALSAGGLHLERLARDFDDEPVDEVSFSALIGALAQAFDVWIAGQSIYDRQVVFDTYQAVWDFHDRWRPLPFRERQGGSRFNNLLWLHLIAKSYAPGVIVDSGSYQGASAWALATACPNARVLSFDIDLSQLRLRADGVSYVQSDWSDYSLGFRPSDRVLCYFDDHVDQVRRLLEAAERGCKLALFDDDYPVTSFYAMAPSPKVLPKLEFALDSSMVQGRVLKWRTGRRTHSWAVDRTYLDAGLARIASTERLPNTSLITGIHQTPYRIVSIDGGARGR